MRSSHTVNIPQVNSYLVFTTQYCQDFRPAAVWPHCIYLSALGTDRSWGPGAIQWLQRARITVWPSGLTEQQCPFLYPGVPLCCCLAEWSPLNSSACLFLHPTICCWTSLALELASKNRVHPFLYPADYLKIAQPVTMFTMQWIRKQKDLSIDWTMWTIFKCKITQHLCTQYKQVLDN